MTKHDTTPPAPPADGEGIPDFLQRPAPTEAERKALDKKVQRANSPQKIKNPPKRASAEAKKLGMAPGEMKKTGAKLKSEKTAKPAKKAKPKKSAAAKPKTSAPASGERKRYDWKSAREAAASGKLPSPPDFTANTHRYYRPKLAELVKLAKDGDSKGLTAYKITGSSTSPTSLKNYRECCLIALKASKA